MKTQDTGSACTCSHVYTHMNTQTPKEHALNLGSEDINKYLIFKMIYQRQIEIINMKEAIVKAKENFLSGREIKKKHE